MTGGMCPWGKCPGGTFPGGSVMSPFWISSLRKMSPYSVVYISGRSITYCPQRSIF